MIEDDKAKDIYDDDKVVIDFDFHERQRLALRVRMSEKYRWILYGGAVGGGKTAYLVRDLILAALYHYPGDVFVVARQELETLRKQVWTLLSDLMPPELIVEHNRSTRPKMTLVNGSVIHGVDAKGISKIWGAEIRAIYVDEAQEVSSEEFWTQINSRLRHGTTGKGSKRSYHYVFCTANPGPGWIYENFIVEQKPGFIFIPSKVEDNPYLGDRDEYLANLRATYSPAQYERFVHGRWDVFEGQVYGEFDEEVHVHDFAIHSSMPLVHVQAMDWGHRNPTVILFMAMDGRGHIWIYDEIYLRQGSNENLPDTVAWRYFQAAGPTGWNLPAEYLAVATDYSAKALQSHGSSAWDDLVERGMPIFEAQKQMFGIHTIKALLGKKMLHISPRCMRLVYEIPRYQWEKQSDISALKSNRSEKPMKKDDHALDAMRYGINYLSRPDIKAVKMVDPYTAAAYIERMNKEAASRAAGVQDGTLEDYYAGFSRF